MPRKRTSVALTCANCGAVRMLPPWLAKIRSYCGHACAALASRREPVSMRVWQSIERRGPDACWPWTASPREGYGQIQDRDSGRRRLAHQVVLEVKIGRPLKSSMGEFALHTCDNRRCCNPAHLYVGSQADNMRDMRERGRHRFGRLRGSEVSTARLRESWARAIRVVLASEPPPGAKAALARLYDVSPSTIERVASGRSWAHVTDAP